MKRCLLIMAAFFVQVLAFSQNQQSVTDNLRGTLWKVKNIYWGFSKDNSTVYIFKDKDDVQGSLVNTLCWSVDDNGKIIVDGTEPEKTIFIPKNSIEVIWESDGPRFNYEYIGPFYADPTSSVKPNPLAGKSISINSGDFRGVITPYSVKGGEQGIGVCMRTSFRASLNGTTYIELFFGKDGEYIKTNQMDYNINGNLGYYETFDLHGARTHHVKNHTVFIPYYVLKNSGLTGWQQLTLYLCVYNTEDKYIAKSEWIPITVYIP